MVREKFQHWPNTFIWVFAWRLLNFLRTKVRIPELLPAVFLS